MKHLYYTHAGGTSPVFVYIPCDSEICQLVELETYPDSDFPDEPEDTISGWVEGIITGDEERPPELDEVDLSEVVIHEL